MFPSGWHQYLAGGVCVGLGVGLLFALTGLIGGVSTMYPSALSLVAGHPFFQHEKFVATRHWRLMYGLGLILGAAVYTVARGRGTVFVTAVPVWRLFVGGVLAGFGARLSGGCTSGHGICGIGSLQKPSILAVLVFLTTAILTAHAARALGGH
ncbi:MAG: YeeE/YedE family protein [Elusimicrobia bacterium]|nr:YeeE/YedE family protein [Elusimicrobiota bacterium]